MQKTKVLVPSGVLGLGFDNNAFENGLKLSPDIISIDGGSTDSGPFSLGTGTSKYSRSSIKSEWKTLMIGRAKLNIPLIIGSCGTCGTNNMVDWMEEITIEIATELNQKLKIAKLYCEISKKELKKKFKNKQIYQLDPPVLLNEDKIDRMAHIVALAGAEQIQNALKTDADIILAGRTTDTAIISALPLMKGANLGSSWHGAKVAECGALCSTDPTSGVVMIEFDKNGFIVFPTSKNAKCTPYTVSAHMLYENSDPFKLYEPGGYMDVSKATYKALDNKKVIVTGAKWLKDKNYFVKLEGAQISGYQTSSLILIRDKKYVNNIEKWTSKLKKFLCKEINKRMSLSFKDYNLQFRHIGKNATLGDLENKKNELTEVGVLCIVTANKHDISIEITKLINPFLLHYPLSDNEELPTFAFPFSPVHADRGALYEFSLNHKLKLKDPMSIFTIKLNEI